MPCHATEREAAGGRCDLLVGAHDGQAQMGCAAHRGGTPWDRVACGWMAIICMYICPRAKSIDIVSPRPLIRTPVTSSSPIITYTHGPDVRPSLRYSLSSPLHSRYNATLVSYRLLWSGHITVTVPSLRPTAYPLTSTRGSPSATHHRRHGTATRTRRA